ncbi:UNVERIFIED_CONTAM: Transcription initiation factor TFIID subunit [Sesamum radiatum]|uniref:Transcription initiation factor TFIID subunit n=1 Tax=Sesamum radiatum TaxID=300843 RepID=A0AAW2LC50_SESRA
MNDGGEAEAKSDVSSTSDIRSGPGDFGRAISRIAVAQVCESIGFGGFNECALDSLADVAIRYICDLGLEDIGMSQGFSGASEIHTDCVVSSGAIKEIKEYVEMAEEIPFSQPDVVQETCFSVCFSTESFAGRLTGDTSLSPASKGLAKNGFTILLTPNPFPPSSGSAEVAAT